jgi:hypothetical protein
MLLLLLLFGSIYVKVFSLVKRASLTRTFSLADIAMGLNEQQEAYRKEKIMAYKPKIFSRAVLLAVLVISCTLSSWAAGISFGSGPGTLDSLSGIGTQADRNVLNISYSSLGSIEILVTNLTFTNNQTGVGVTGFLSGEFFTVMATNNTGQTWGGYNVELCFSVCPSTPGDGLSFAQGSPFTATSTTWALMTPIDGTAGDRREFSVGMLPTGTQGVVNFTITRNTFGTNPVRLILTPTAAPMGNEIPEPSSIAMLVLGGIAIAVAQLRRRAKNN